MQAPLSLGGTAQSKAQSATRTVLQSTSRNAARDLVQSTQGDSQSTPSRSNTVQGITQGAPSRSNAVQGMTQGAPNAVQGMTQGVPNVAQSASSVAQGASTVPNVVQDTLEAMTKLPSAFRVHNDQISVTIYKGDSSLCYHVIASVDKESYYLRNGADFLSTEPILPKEHLRMQQLMIREKRERCLFRISYRDIEDVMDVIHIELDECLFTYLSNRLA